ncbi:MAG: hypothetical protein Q7R76_03145 [Candidatus Woesearchaeota archaeon]|nr:hypothetical protein [Candidatus Woesearchaeota archaeon]
MLDKTERDIQTDVHNDLNKTHTHHEHDGECVAHQSYHLISSFL